MLLLEPWKEVLKHRNEVIEEVLHDKYSTINVEKVVKALGIADVKCKNFHFLKLFPLNPGKNS